MDKYTFKQNYTCEITGKQYKANDKIYEKNNMLFTIYVRKAHSFRCGMDSTLNLMDLVYKTLDNIHK